MIINHLDAYAIVACSDPPAINAANAIRLCASVRRAGRLPCLLFSFLHLLSRAALDHDVAADPDKNLLAHYTPAVPNIG